MQLPALRLRSITAGAVAVLSAGVLYACDDAPTTSATSRSGESRSVAAMPTSAESAVHLSSRVERMRTEVSWVGEIHRRAMDDVVANRAQWLAGAGAREDRVCSAITRLMLKYSPEIETYAGGFASQA